MKRLIISLIISLNIITAQKLLMGNDWNQHSGVEINDIFEETNEQPPASDHSILDNFPPQHLNTMTNQREYWFNSSTLKQNWSGSEWMNDWQRTQTYDSNNNYIGDLYQDWDDTLWVNDSQNTYTYDVSNNCIGRLYQDWVGNQWVNSRLYTYTYDANNNQILMLRQNWDGTQWVNYYQYANTYDANNNQTSYLYQNWDGQWVNYYQDTYTYDANNNRTSYLAQETDGTQLVNDRQYTYTWVSSNPIIDTIPDQEIDEDQSLVLTLSAQSPPVWDVLYVFSAYSDTSAVILDVNSDTLHIVPAANWVGTALITVIVDPDNDASSDTTGFTLTVTPVNDSPEPFSVIYPSVSDTFSTHTDKDTLIQFTWGESNDIDSDITYKLTIELEFFGNIYTDIHENISDTSIGVSSNSLDNLLGGLNIDETELHWYINALDEEYTVVSDTGEFVLSRAALGSVDGYAIPEQFSLHQNYPNPFNPITTLRYDLPEDGLVNIIIYDMLGRQVKTLINQTQDAGYRSVIWDATNDYGKPVSAGIYLYQIQSGEYISTKKMVLLK